MDLKRLKFWPQTKDKKPDEDLYTRVLLWAHKKQESGFTWQEMQEKFKLTGPQESWVRKIFLTADGNDRKFFEHLRNDDTVEPNQHYYSLNEKGITAAINYKNLSHAEKGSRWALWFAGLSIFLTAVGLWFTHQSLQLVTLPQVDYYLQLKEGDENGTYEFGMENNGVVPISDITLSHSQVNIYRKGCSRFPENGITCGGSGVGLSDMFTVKERLQPILPAQTRTVDVIISGPDEQYIHVLKMDITYERDVDRQKSTEEIVFFIDGVQIYSLDEVRDIPRMELYVAAFRELSADTTLSNPKMYWR